jgi:hypothetical protein
MGYFLHIIVVVDIRFIIMVNVIGKCGIPDIRARCGHNAEDVGNAWSAKGESTSHNQKISGVRSNMLLEGESAALHEKAPAKVVVGQNRSATPISTLSPEDLRCVTLLVARANNDRVHAPC